MFHTITNHTKTNQTKTKHKITLKDFIIGMICTVAIIAGIALTPYQASADTVTSITVDETKTTLEYQVGSTISTSDVYININAEINSTQCSTLPDVRIDVPENAAVGRKTIKITYAGQETTYDLVVIPKTPTMLALNKLDFDKIRAYSTPQQGITGAHFAFRLNGATSYTSMGATIRKDGLSRYYDDVEYMKPGSTYFFKVQTYAVVNGEIFYSKWSTDMSVVIAQLNGADRWRPETKRQLLAHGVYSKTRENIIINIIQHESGGNEMAGKGRTCVGLLQFSSGWKHNNAASYYKTHGIYNYKSDNRLSGSWSLHRVAVIIKAGGTNALKQYWPSTWNK